MDTQGMTTRERGGQWRVALLFVAFFTALTVPPTAAQGRRAPKFDHQLREAIAQADTSGDSDRPIKVIVRTRPGARAAARQKLGRHGGRVTSEFGVISGSAAALKPRHLKELENDPDVVSISVDADVHADGVASSLTGNPQNGAYNLRSTLGLRSVSATSATRTFQQGNAAGYTGVVDTDVQMYYPTMSRGSSTHIEIDNDSGLTDGYQWALIRFDNLFGTATNQIPPGSTITSATLTLNHLADGNSSASASLHQMLVDWSGTSTWNSLAVSGVGVQFDNIEARSAADATVSNLAVAGAKVFSGSALTAAVQAWANGQPNRGWVVKQTQDNGWILRSSEDATAANRPLLSISYKAPVNTTSLTGAGVTVAVIDSGLYEDGGGTTRIKTTRDFTTGLTNPAAISPVDSYGHGTHIATLIGGNKTEVEGVAPGVQFVSLRVLDSLGVGSTSHVITAIQWTIANKVTYGIDVLNVSLGHPIYEAATTDPLVQAVESAVRAGITVVVAAGNIGIGVNGQVGYGGITSPGNAPSAITVGAARTFGTTTRQDDLVSDFSSRGPTWFDAYAKPDVVAPGQFVLGAATTTQTLYNLFPTLRGQSFGGRAYLNLSGTSMSAGVVSGTVALMIEQSRLLFGTRPTSNALKAMLMRSAIPMTNASGVRYSVLAQGAGSVNAYGAAQLAAALNPTAPVNFNWVAGTIPLTTAIDNQVLGWNDNVVWGTNVLWGDSLDTRLLAWNDNVVWGTGDNVVWGTSLQSRSMSDNVVWGTNYQWVENVVWGANVVWGTSDDNVVWGTNDNVVWGTGDNVVWGTGDNVVWGTAVLTTPQP